MELVLHKLRGRNPKGLNQFFNLYVDHITDGWTPNDGGDIEAINTGANLNESTDDSDAHALNMVRRIID